MSYPRSRESKNKRASRPVFYPSDKAHPLRGLLPEEIAAFYARIDAIRQRALARAAVKSLERARLVRASTKNSIYSCRPALR